MCTARVGSDAGHDVGPGVYGCKSTADSATVQEMHAATGVSIWTSMGTYSGFSDPGMATLVNEVEWYHANFAHRWGMGLCPHCPTPMGIPVRPVEILLRLSLARAYGVAEIDVFAFASSNAEEFEIYWPMLKAIRGCDGSSANGVPGRCWPVLGGEPWWPHSCDNQTPGPAGLICPPLRARGTRSARSRARSRAPLRRRLGMRNRIGAA